MTSPDPAAGGPPIWLPDPMDSGGDWVGYIDRLWERYLDDFVRSNTYWRGKRVQVDKDPQSSGKDHSFWHVISGIDRATKELLDPEPERCARLCWIKPILEVPADEVRSWVQRSNGFVNIALPDFSYRVIVKELKWTAFLKSAWYVERPTRREQFRKEYEASEKR